MGELLDSTRRITQEAIDGRDRAKTETTQRLINVISVVIGGAARRCEYFASHVIQATGEDWFPDAVNDMVKFYRDEGFGVSTAYKGSRGLAPDGQSAYTVDISWRIGEHD